MMRRFLCGVVVVGCLGVGALFGAEHLTVILGDGDRISGTLISPGGRNDRHSLSPRDLYLLTDDGRETPIRLNQVAVIQFGGGRPTPTELGALPHDNTQMIVRRNGSIESGRLISITPGGDVVRWQARNGRQQTIRFRDLTRIYLNTDRARAAFNDTDRFNPGFRDRNDSRAGNRNDPGFGNRNDPGFGNPNNRGVGTSGPERNIGDVRVDANQAWTSTGLNVRAGDLVAFRASGRISFGQGATQTAGPDGNESLKRAEYPVSGWPVGGLIGRVGNSAPFPIGSSTQPIRMPANGMLMLGANDNELTDNSGFFTVAITRQ